MIDHIENFIPKVSITGFRDNSIKLNVNNIQVIVMFKHVQQEDITKLGEDRFTLRNLGLNKQLVVILL